MYTVLRVIMTLDFLWAFISLSWTLFLSFSLSLSPSLSRLECLGLPTVCFRFGRCLHLRMTLGSESSGSVRGLRIWGNVCVSSFDSAFSNAFSSAFTSTFASTFASTFVSTYASTFASIFAATLTSASAFASACYWDIHLLEAYLSLEYLWLYIKYLHLKVCNV